MMKTGRNFMIGAAVMAVSVLTPLTSFAATCTNILPGCNYGNSTGIVTVIGGNKTNCPGGKDCGTAGKDCSGKDCGISGKQCNGADNCSKPGCTDKNNAGGLNNSQGSAIKNLVSLLGQGSSCSR